MIRHTIARGFTLRIATGLNSREQTNPRYNLALRNRPLPPLSLSPALTELARQ